MVARLVVSPLDRHQGIGQALLATAQQEASNRGLWPILDVVTRSTDAIRLYERCGWQQLGQVALLLDEVVIDEYVYIQPAGYQGPAAGEVR